MSLLAAFEWRLAEAIFMPHKRCFDRLQYRVVRGLIFRHAYLDRFRGEVVSRLSRLDVLGLLNFEGFSLNLVPNVERGEVLVDTRGTGSFQKKPV
ncbi:MAG: hypothetical protein QXN95_00315 [Candidatus Bathyarchaeia archaeon]